MMVSTASILDQFLEPVITVDVARRLVALRANATTQAHLDELAAKNTEGMLTPEERKEYESYVTAIDLISLLQARARKLLRQQGE